VTGAPRLKRGTRSQRELVSIVLLIICSGSSDALLDILEKLLVLFLSRAVGASEFNQAVKHMSEPSCVVATRRDSMFVSEILDNPYDQIWVSMLAKNELLEKGVTGDLKVSVCQCLYFLHVDRAALH